MTLDIGPTISNGRVKFAPVDYAECPHLKTLAEDLLSTIHAAEITPLEAEALLEDLPRLLKINSVISPPKNETIEIRLHPEAKECIYRLSDQVSALKKTLHSMSALEQLFNVVQLPVDARDILGGVAPGNCDSSSAT